jgi:hypothetical protein
MTTKSKQRIFLLIAALAFILSVPALVFADEVQDLKKEMQGLKDELKTLKQEIGSSKGISSEQRASGDQDEVNKDDLNGVIGDLAVLRDQWQRTLDKNTAQSTRSLTLGATIQTRYAVKNNHDATNSKGFSIPFLLLSFRGNLYKDYEQGKNLEYLVTFYSDTTADSYRVKPQDVYINYNLLNTLDSESPRLAFSLGQQKKPFGRDPQTTEEFKPTINLAQFDQNLGIGVRDIGLVAKGDLFPTVDFGYNYRVPLIEYQLGFINGSGPNAADANQSKDYAGRIALNAPVGYNSIFRGLSIGASFYTGKALKTLTANGATTYSRDGLEKRRIGWDIAYVNTPVGATLEYAKGVDENLSGTAAAPVVTKVNSSGYVATVFYNFGQQFVKGYKNQNRYDDWYPSTFQPFVRYDHWEPNDKKQDDVTNITTLGFNWFFAETTKLQFNYNIKKFEDPTKPNTSEFLAQFQYGF